MAQTFLSHPASPLASPKAVAGSSRSVRWRPGKLTGYGLALGVSVGAWSVVGLIVARFV